MILGQRRVYREARTGSSFVIAGVFNSLFYFIRRPWCLYLHFCLLLPLVCISIPLFLSLSLLVVLRLPAGVRGGDTIELAAVGG